MRQTQRFIPLLLLLSACVCMLFGCTATNSGRQHENPLDKPSTSAVGATFGEGLADEDLPAVVSTSILTDPIAVVPWNSNRCEVTSWCRYGEVEEGLYYGSANMSLAFAEKSDLDEWFVVCPFLDCKHAAEPDGCPSLINSNFVIRNERIYYSGTFEQYEKFWNDDPEPGAFMFLASVSQDGTGTKIEHIFDSSNISLNQGGGFAMYISPEYAIYCRIVLNSGGLYDAHIYILDENGEHLVYDEDIDFQPGGGGYGWDRKHNTFGDRMFLCGILDPTWQLPFILTEDYTIEQVDLTGLPEEGAYLSDNIYRCFRANDGYYDVNLETREETKLEEAQLENSHAFVVLPNCILESTLMGYTSLPMQSNVQQNAMKLFDGQRWWDVELPEELLEVKGKYLDVEAITSDRILLRLQENKDVILYQIFLGTDRPVMEYAGTVEYQELPESW